MLCIPGGFSYGDDIAAGRILANQIRHHLNDVLTEFQAEQKLILGICNGFQILIKAGVLLPDNASGGADASLTWNDSGRFEDRWIHLAADAGPCVFLKGVQRMYLPIAHAEGKFVVQNDQTLNCLQQQQQLVLRYCDEQGQATNELLPFPCNPNGSVANVAGMCDRSGRVLGLMPHPERHIDRTHHPRWTRGEGQDPGDGLAIFRNAVDYFSA